MGAMIKLFDVCKGKYFYDVGRNQIVKVSNEEYKSLLAYKNMDDSEFFKLYEHNESVQNNIKKYTDKGFLSNKKAKRIIHPYTYIAEDVLSKKLHMAILQVTQMCNLKCRYCPYSGNGYLDRKHLNKSMSIDTAKKSIDFIVDNGIFSNEYNIGFYGGEPLIYFELIKETVGYIQSKVQEKDISFFITTNGTLLSKEVIKFLAENNFSVTISLDGPPDIHDKNRRQVLSGGGSFDVIYRALETISTEFPSFVNRIGVNAVWDMEESYSEILNFFVKDPVLSKFEFSISPVDNTIIDTSFSMVNDNFHEQQFNNMISMMDNVGLIKLNNSENDKSSLKIVEDFEAKLTPRIELPDECHFGGMCLPGYNRLFIDCDGNMFPCEKVSANSKTAKIGNVFEGFDYSKIKKIMNVGALTANECKNCWCGQFCTCCFKFVDDLNKMSREKKLNECQQIKRSVLKTMKEYVMLKETRNLLMEIDDEYCFATIQP